MPETPETHDPVWFAYLTGEGGYTLDAYPGEVSRYFRELRRSRVRLLGLYRTREAAMDAVRVNLRGRQRYRMRRLKSRQPAGLHGTRCDDPSP